MDTVRVAASRSGDTVALEGPAEQTASVGHSSMSSVTVAVAPPGAGVASASAKPLMFTPDSGGAPATATVRVKLPVWRGAAVDASITKSPAASDNASDNAPAPAPESSSSTTESLHAVIKLRMGCTHPHNEPAVQRAIARESGGRRCSTCSSSIKRTVVDVGFPPGSPMS